MEKGLEIIGFRVCIFVESVVGQVYDSVCPFQPFWGSFFSFQAGAAIQPFESPRRGRKGKRKKARSEEFPLCGRLRPEPGLGKNGVRIEK